MHKVKGTLANTTRKKESRRATQKNASWVREMFEHDELLLKVTCRILRFHMNVRKIGRR